MRIISGQYRGKKLNSPIGESVRPTSDRIKESEFNILCNKVVIEGAKVLDLFCGSGALGIECISRGADNVIFADKSMDSIKLTRMNLDSINNQSEVYNVSYELALKRIPHKLDIIFVDPPYRDRDVNKIVDMITKQNILRVGGVIIVEHSKDNVITYDELTYNIDRRTMGKTSLDFLTKIKDEPLQQSGEGEE